MIFSVNFDRLWVTGVFPFDKQSVRFYATMKDDASGVFSKIVLTKAGTVFMSLVGAVAYLIAWRSVKTDSEYLAGDVRPIFRYSSAIISYTFATNLILLICVLLKTYAPQKWNQVALRNRIRLGALVRIRKFTRFFPSTAA